MQNWDNCDRTFLVTIYNISSIQKHTTFRTPANSTAINVITQVKKDLKVLFNSRVALVNVKDSNDRYAK
jgi:hypothetical protein